MNDKFYRRLKKAGITPKHVAEVGVYLPETSNILGFIEDGCQADLFEPDPLSLEKIYEYFRHRKNVTVYPVAIYHERTTLGLYRTNASTFVETLSVSPALINDKYLPNDEDKFYVEAKLFSDFDDGTIDLLSIDTEGCEWYVIETMKSRPAVISLETHGKKYTNPYLANIKKWMNYNGYKVWYRDRSDTVYIKKDIRIGFFSKWL
jgi:FkbM family methyltransferase